MGFSSPQLSYHYLISIDESTCESWLPLGWLILAMVMGVERVNWLPTLTQDLIRNLILFADSLSLSESIFLRKQCLFFKFLQNICLDLGIHTAISRKFKEHRSGGLGFFSNFTLRSLWMLCDRLLSHKALLIVHVPSVKSTSGNSTIHICELLSLKFLFLNGPSGAKIVELIISSVPSTVL